VRVKFYLSFFPTEQSSPLSTPEPSQQQTNVVTITITITIIIIIIIIFMVLENNIIENKTFTIPVRISLFPCYKENNNKIINIILP